MSGLRINSKTSVKYGHCGLQFVVIRSYSLVHTHILLKLRKLLKWSDAKPNCDAADDRDDTPHDRLLDARAASLAGGDGPALVSHVLRPGTQLFL